MNRVRDVSPRAAVQRLGDYSGDRPRSVLAGSLGSAPHDSSVTTRRPNPAYPQASLRPSMAMEAEGKPLRPRLVFRSPIQCQSRSLDVMPLAAFERASLPRLKHALTLGRRRGVLGTFQHVGASISAGRPLQGLGVVVVVTTTCQFCMGDSDAGSETTEVD